MPWHIEKRGDEYCVIKNDDGDNEGCHPSREEAEDQLAALYATEKSKDELTVEEWNAAMAYAVERVETEPTIAS